MVDKLNSPIKTKNEKYGVKKIRYKTLFLSFALLCLLLSTFTSSVTAQDSVEEESAQVAVAIDGDIPSISNENWTSVNLILYDQFGISWAKLSQFPKVLVRVIWPITLGPFVRRFTGFTSIELYPEIIEGDPTGWEVRMNKSVVEEADQGRVYKRTLEVQTNRLAVDYSVIIAIKIVRKDVWGDVAGISYAYIPVKSSPFNYLELKSVNPSIKASPKSIVYFQVDITNKGYYEDIFQFDIKSDDDLLGIANEQSIDIKPGETKRISIGVLTKETFYDPGTPHVIDIYVYSTGDPTKTKVGSVIIITEGFYISPLVGIILAPIIIFLIIIYLLFFYLKTKKDKELYGKPEKPWNIPEEKTHLDELKQKNKEAYEKERLMMEDEYKSTMLWYENYRAAMKRTTQKPKLKEKISTLKNKLFKKLKRKKVKQPKEKEKQPKKEKEKKVEKTIKEEKVKETPEIVKEQYKTIQKKSEEMQRRKEKALLKIKHAQEKQKRKIKK